MAQQKTRSQGSRDMDMNEETQASRPQGQTQGRGQQRGRQGAVQTQDQQQQPDILASITPAFQEARRYIEGSPVRAAAVGAIAGGVLMTLFSTEKGRSFVKMAYDYANPVVAKYAREYITQAAGDMTEQALGQH